MPSFYMAAAFSGALVLATQVSAYVPHEASTPENRAPSVAPVQQIVAMNLDSAQDLSLVLNRVGFDLAGIRAGDDDVPAFYLASLPLDLGTHRQIDQKKELFFSAVLPLVLRANERVARERVKLVRFRDRLLDGARLRHAEYAWLLRLSDRYGVLEPEATIEAIDEAVLNALTLRVDEIPASLALAQAAIESGWGSSRFTRQGNALFGQRAWRETDGIVPFERDDDEIHVVRHFDTLLASVRSYVHNLNTHESYVGLRRARADMRSTGRQVDGSVLAGGLLRYAETGEEYITLVRSVIKKNRLDDFDGAVLERRLAALAS